MHIQEGTYTTLTTCTKMTEEVDRRHGVNGNGSSKGVSEEVPPLNSANSASGGRLKFFKDGKFILELVRGAARDGERPGWVSVPRKTFWPPPAAPAAGTAVLPRAERAASLSVSDDNSSIQSSPWQRDHCWKQSTPRRNISKELTFYYCRPSTLSNAAIEAAARAKRRRPHAAPPAPAPAAPARSNGVRNGSAGSPDGADAVDGADDERWKDADREKYYHMKLKKPYQYHKLRVYKKTRPSIKRKVLNATVDRLREKVSALPAPVHAKLASCRQQEHACVSPRKRILRELERVSLEGEGKRRARPPPAAPAPGPSAPARPAPPKHVSNYSIHSLLSMGSAPSPPRPAPAEPAHDSPPPHYRYPRPPSPYARGFAAYRREEPRDAYLYAGYGGFPPPGAGVFRAPPLWMHYAMSPPALPGAWPPPLAHPLYTDHLPKDEPSSDLPLNLSKH